MVGCASNRKQGVSRLDDYESVRVDQMVGNNVSGRVFERTIVCLNARKETRTLDAITNLTVTLVTNFTLLPVTNLTVTLITNQSRTLATNLVAAPTPAPSSIQANEPPAASGAVSTNAPVIATATAAADSASAPETNALANAAATGLPNSSTNVSATTGSNVTLSKAGHQTVTTANYQKLLSRQVTLTTNNVSVTTAENQAITTETNQVVNVVTNLLINSVTNQSIVARNVRVEDYYLCVEYTPPPDFVLQSGESLVLLVDGARHSLAATNSPSVLVPRKGFVGNLYKTAPELLAAIANAKEVKLRLKGVNTVIEKKMSFQSRENFKKFLAKYPAQSAVAGYHSPSQLQSALVQAKP